MVSVQGTSMAEAIGEQGLAAFARGDMAEAVARFERALERRVRDLR